MFLRVFKAQFLHICRQKSLQAVFFCLLGAVALNFIRNVLDFRGLDYANMYDSMKILLLSYNRTYYNADSLLLIIQIYPLLIAIPAGLAFTKERDLKLNVLLQTRIGGTLYRISKLAAVFSATFLVFTIPFLIEIALNCIAFPLSSTKDFSHYGVYSDEYIQMVRNYWCYKLYLLSPQLYAVVMTILWGAFAGILGAFVMAFSTVVSLRFRVLYLLPPYILLSGSVYLLPKLFGGSMEHVWYKYLLLFGDGDKYSHIFIMLVGALAAFSIAATLFSARKDCLQ